MSKKKGIIILPDNFTKFKFLPSKFDYFSLNPEKNEDNCLKYFPVNIFSGEHLTQLAKFQKNLNKTSIPVYLLPNTIKYDLNFKFSNRLYIQIIKNNLKEITGRDVFFINDFNHNSFYLVFLNFILTFKLSLNLGRLIVFPFALFRLLSTILEKNLSILFANKLTHETVEKNIEVSNKLFFVSDNPKNRYAFPIKSILQLIQVFLLPLTFFIFAYTFIRHNDIIIKLKINPVTALRNISIYISCYFLRRILYFDFISISNYKLSEALFLSNYSRNDFVINHGVHYFDKNQLINHFWKFHSQTMFGKISLMSNNVLDFIFLKKNKINSNYVFKPNTIRKQNQKIDPKVKKSILIADTFKNQNSVRPLIYNTAFEYVDFINQICEVVPNSYDIVLRHRKNTILSDEYVSKINKRIVLSKNDDIYKDFLSDPILISYSSTVLFEAMELGLRVVSFDPYNRGMNFLNLYNFCHTKTIPQRFQIKVNNKEDLQNLLCRV